jgi:hypothetical protein
MFCYRTVSVNVRETDAEENNIHTFPKKKKHLLVYAVNTGVMINV